MAFQPPATRDFVDAHVDVRQACYTFLNRDCLLELRDILSACMAGSQPKNNEGFSFLLVVIAGHMDLHLTLSLTPFAALHMQCENACLQALSQFHAL